MPSRRIGFALLAFVLFVHSAEARTRAAQHPGWPLGTAPFDKFTSSNTSDVTTKHLALDLTVDFAKRELRGSATLYLNNITGTSSLRLDAEGLAISKITLDGTTPTTWTETTGIVRGIDIAITPATERVTIEYSTSASGNGLFWHAADETFGGVQPFLYTQNEAIDARYWIPIQDTPAMRMTWEATVHVPSNLMAVMSAGGNPTTTNDSGVYHFNMRFPVPSYLIALAVGRLEFRALDERTGIYAEPELIDDAAWEVHYLPDMVDAAERILGRFPFDRHDLLFGPPGYIVGGMEHPMLNFITPTSVTGNRSNVTQPASLFAHELAHSWAGDATTLANWNDVWLNEGITSYLALRILEEMSGAEVGAHGWWNERRNFEPFAKNDTTMLTVMHWDVADPFDGFGPNGYDKGALFIRTLEDTFGRERFDPFLRRYFQIFAFRWVDDANFIEALRTLLLANEPKLESQLLLDQWLYQPGVPSNISAPTTSPVQQRALQRASQFAAGKPIAQLAPETWSDLDKVTFLQVTDVRPRMAEVDAALGLSAQTIPPQEWLIASARTNYGPGMEAVERLLARGKQLGRMRSLYLTMYDIPAMRPTALQLFERYRNSYDARTERNIAELLHLTTTNALRNAA